mgnify:CR=1 FL=1
MKTRIQMLQEGKTFSGVAFEKGFYGENVFNETLKAGGGLRKFYSTLDSYFMRTLSYTTFRISGFLYFYDWINPDSRREARQDFYVMAAYAGGMAGGILSNPCELVFSRM